MYELLIGLLLGFSLAAPPGPMNALIAAESMRGFRRGVVTGLGAMSADAVLGAVVYFARSVVDVHEYVRVIYALGCGVVAYFGVRLLVRRPEGPEPIAPPARTFASAFVLGVSNPFQILWWLTAGLAFAYLGGALLFVGLFGAIAVWIVAFPAVVSAGASRAPRAVPGVRLVSGAVLLGFAAYFAWLAV